MFFSGDGRQPISASVAYDLAHIWCWWTLFRKPKIGECLKKRVKGGERGGKEEREKVT